MSNKPHFIPRFDNSNLLMNTAFIKYIGCDELKCNATIHYDGLVKIGNGISLDRDIECNKGSDCYDRMKSFYEMAKSREKCYG